MPTTSRMPRSGGTYRLPMDHDLGRPRGGERLHRRQHGTAAAALRTAPAARAAYQAYWGTCRCVCAPARAGRHHVPPLCVRRPDRSVMLDERQYRSAAMSASAARARSQPGVRSTAAQTRSIPSGRCLGGPGAVARAVPCRAVARHLLLSASRCSSRRISRRRRDKLAIRPMAGTAMPRKRVLDMMLRARTATLVLGGDIMPSLPPMPAKGRSWIGGDCRSRRYQSAQLGS